MLLSYRLPREPSTPRITVWRKLKRLGVAQISDGLVALPADPRTREHLDWLADDIIEADGTATVWLAQPTNRQQEHQLATTMADARADEYRAVLAEALRASGLPASDRSRMLRKLRAELRRINRRDYFPPPERQAAVNAVNALHPDQKEDTAS